MAKELNPIITLKNNKKISIQGSRSHHCRPLLDSPKEGYTHYEVACFCHERDNAPYMAQYEYWGVYAKVPKSLVERYISENGGILSGCLP